MIFRILHNILIVCVVLGFQNNFFGRGGMSSANFKYVSLNSVVVPNSPFNQISIQDSLTAVMLNLQNNVNNSISQNALNDNLLPVGDIGYMVTAAINFGIPNNPDDYGIPSIDCTSDKCINARALVNNNISTPLYSSFQKIKENYYAVYYAVIIFDTRNESWTNENTTNSVSFTLNEVIPILSSFSIRTNIDIIYQDKIDNTILSKIILTTCIKCSLSGGSYFTASNGGTPYRGGVYEDEPWRLLMLILAFFVNLYEICSEVEDYTISSEQSRSSYWYNKWNWLDWAVQLILLVCIPLAWIAISNISRNGFGYEPINTASEWYTQAMPLGSGIAMIGIQWVAVLVFFINLLRFFKSFRYHISLRIYLRFLKELGNMIGGFVSFFVILAIQFALLFYIITSVSGFNDSFRSLSESVNEILQVTFGFVDYDSFTNSNFGFGEASIFVIIFFYGAVIIFTVIMQNIILAIIGNAHDVARRPENSNSNIIGLLTALILFYAITTVPIVLCSVYSSVVMLLYKDSKRVTGATKALNIIDPFIAKYCILIDPLWKKFSAFTRHGNLFKCLSFVYIDCQSDELKITHKGKVLKFPEDTRVSVNLELIGRAPWTDEATKKHFSQISRASKGFGTVKKVWPNNVLELRFTPLADISSASTVPSELSQKFSIFSEVDDIPEDVVDCVVSGIFPAPSSAFNIFNESLKRVELEELLKVATAEVSDTGLLLNHPLLRQSLFQKIDKDDIVQAAYEFFELFFKSEMNSYKVFKSNIESSRQCTSVFEVVDDGIDSKRRFEQTYTGGFRNSILYQKLDESNSMLHQKLDESKSTLLDEIKNRKNIETIISEINNLKEQVELLMQTQKRE